MCFVIFGSVDGVLSDHTKPLPNRYWHHPFSKYGSISSMQKEVSPANGQALSDAGASADRMVAKIPYRLYTLFVMVHTRNANHAWVTVNIFDSEEFFLKQL